MKTRKIAHIDAIEEARASQRWYSPITQLGKQPIQDFAANIPALQFEKTKKNFFGYEKATPQLRALVAAIIAAYDAGKSSNISTDSSKETNRKLLVAAIEHQVSKEVLQDSPGDLNQIRKMLVAALSGKKAEFNEAFKEYIDFRYTEYAYTEKDAREIYNLLSAVTMKEEDLELFFTISGDAAAVGSAHNFDMNTILSKESDNINTKLQEQSEHLVSKERSGLGAEDTLRSSPNSSSVTAENKDIIDSFVQKAIEKYKADLENELPKIKAQIKKDQSDHNKRRVDGYYNNIGMSLRGLKTLGKWVFYGVLSFFTVLKGYKYTAEIDYKLNDLDIINRSGGVYTEDIKMVLSIKHNAQLSSESSNLYKAICAKTIEQKPKTIMQLIKDWVYDVFSAHTVKAYSRVSQPVSQPNFASMIDGIYTESDSLKPVITQNLSARCLNKDQQGDNTHDRVLKEGKSAVLDGGGDDLITLDGPLVQGASDVKSIAEKIDYRLSVMYVDDISELLQQATTPEAVKELNEYKDGDGYNLVCIALMYSRLDSAIALLEVEGISINYDSDGVKDQVHLLAQDMYHKYDVEVKLTQGDLIKDIEILKVAEEQAESGSRLEPGSFGGGK